MNNEIPTSQGSVSRSVKNFEWEITILRKLYKAEKEHREALENELRWANMMIEYLRSKEPMDGFYGGNS
jgi:hypothetical protein